MNDFDSTGYGRQGNRVKFRKRLHWIGITIVVCAMAGCGGGDTESEAGTETADLDLGPFTETPTENAASSELRLLPNGLAEKTWTVPPTFLTGPGGDGGGAAAADPFAGPSGGEGSGLEKRQTAKSTLQDYGVSFAEQAGAIYDPATGTLTVTAGADQLALVDAIMDSLNDGLEKNINFRIEIYELPALLALKLEQSAESHADHTPEWEATLRLLEKGEVRFVTSAMVSARSGQRAMFEDIREHIYIADYEWANDEKKEQMVPVFETRNVGTTLEIDPVLGPDNTIIDINLSPEYHSAPPTEKMVSIRFPESDEVVEIPMPQFHVKKITTQITMADGHKKLLGAWRSTGNPEVEKADLMLIMFLSADVQPVYDIGPVGR